MAVRFYTLLERRDRRLIWRSLNFVLLSLFAYIKQIISDFALLIYQATSISMPAEVALPNYTHSILIL